MISDISDSQTHLARVCITASEWYHFQLRSEGVGLKHPGKRNKFEEHASSLITEKAFPDSDQTQKPSTVAEAVAAEFVK